jgi:uncharacterized protein YuzE
MKVNYCPETDSPYIDLSSKLNVDSRQRSEDVVLDYAEVKDLEIINSGDELNKEALDVLDYQVAL